MDALDDRVGYLQINRRPGSFIYDYQFFNKLIITASPTSSKNDFDYLVGKWKMKNKHLNSRLNNCKEWTEFESTVEDFSGLEGMGNFDIVRRDLNGKIYEGRTIRTFDPATRLWRLYWIDSNGGPLDPPVIGSFSNGIGLFFCKDVQVGRPVIVVFKWDKTNPEQPVWSQLSPTTMERPGNGITPILRIE